MTRAGGAVRRCREYVSTLPVDAQFTVEDAVGYFKDKRSGKHGVKCYLTTIEGIRALAAISRSGAIIVVCVETNDYGKRRSVYRRVK